GTNGVNQVGSGRKGAGDEHALLWSGTASSVIDLQSYVPESYPGTYAYPASYATDIDSLGNIVGYVIDANGYPHAAMWLVPEPASMAMMIIFGAGMACRRRR